MLDPLRELARSYGVQLDYLTMDGQERPASSESLLAVLRALGADLSEEAGAARALSERRLSHWRRRVEPVVVAWGDAPAAVEVRLPSALESSRLDCRLMTESGE